MAETQERHPADPVNVLQEQNDPQDDQQQTKPKVLDLKETICQKGFVVPLPLSQPSLQSLSLASTSRRRTRPIQIPDKPFPFLSLPSELRNKVYQSMVSYFAHKKLSYRIIRKARSVPHAVRQLFKYTRRFLRTNKQIWRELLPLHLQTFVWEFHMDYNPDHPHPTTVIPHDSWLNKPSTHSIYLNVRFAYFTFRVNRAFTHPWAGPNSIFATYYCKVEWDMNVTFIACEPYWRVQVAVPYYPIRYAYNDEAIGQELLYPTNTKDRDISKRLHHATSEAIIRIIERKKSERDHVYLLSKGDWEEVMVAFYETSYAVVAELGSDDINASRRN